MQIYLEKSRLICWHIHSVPINTLSKQSYNESGVKWLLIRSKLDILVMVRRITYTECWCFLLIRVILTHMCPTLVIQVLPHYHHCGAHIWVILTHMCPTVVIQALPHYHHCGAHIWVILTLMCPTLVTQTLLHYHHCGAHIWVILTLMWPTLVIQALLHCHHCGAHNMSHSKTEQHDTNSVNLFLLIEHKVVTEAHNELL